MFVINIPKFPEQGSIYKTTVTESPPGGWKLLWLMAGPSPSTWIATIRLGACNSAGVSRQVLLALPRWLGRFGVQIHVLCVDEGITNLTVHLYGHKAAPQAVRIGLFSLPRGIAALLTCLQNPKGFFRALETTTGPRLARLRKSISLAATAGSSIPNSYPVWVELFDVWPADRLEPLFDLIEKREAPSVEALIFTAGPEGSLPQMATLSSLNTQHIPATRVSLGYVPPEAEYVAVLQAGEVLPPHALLVLTAELVKRGRPAILLADEDCLKPDGERHSPIFKPQPNLSLVCSGTLSRGIWLIRSDLLAGMEGSTWAECIRIVAWFRSREVGQAGSVFRIPYVLTHRRHDVENAPVAELAKVVECCLTTEKIPASIVAEFPLRVRRLPGCLASSKVSIIIPSKLNSDLTLNCMTEILKQTTYKNFNMLSIVTQSSRFTETQQRNADILCSDKRVRVKLLNLAEFNYSKANNYGVDHTESDFICLLNDDVVPLDSEWLERMLSFFTDRDVGIVGAKLYYPNMVVQHGGVIMGLAGVCEHANRFLKRGDPGYAWRGVLDQEMSAVTGACMLIRRSVFEEVGGLDEGLPIAFNDVDLCMRVRNLGHTIVFAGSVELLHYETISFGRHYAEHAEREKRDIKYILERWGEQIGNDPFHNPNLSLVLREEWEPAFPPRVERCSAS